MMSRTEHITNWFICRFTGQCRKLGADDTAEHDTGIVIVRLSRQLETARQVVVRVGVVIGDLGVFGVKIEGSKDDIVNETVEGVRGNGL